MPALYESRGAVMNITEQALAMLGTIGALVAACIVVTLALILFFWLLFLWEGRK